AWQSDRGSRRGERSRQRAWRPSNRRSAVQGGSAFLTEYRFLSFPINVAPRRARVYSIEQMFDTEPTASTYGKLARTFDVTFSDVRGGIEVTFISGEQVVSRLNEVLGVAGWSFRILRHEISPEADAARAL